MNPEEIPAWVPFLKRSILFRDLSSEDLVKVASRLKPLSMPRGATLYSRGDAGSAFYLITSGQVRLLSERAGREVVTALLGRGDALGEISLLTGEPRSVTVKLDSTSEFLMLSKKDFEEVMRENPSIMIHLSRIIAQRMLRSQQVPVVTKTQDRKLLAVVGALKPSERALFHLHLALAILEETRKRVLLVDMGPDCGALAKALGLKPVLTSESMLKERDLRDPEILDHLVTEHPSGLRVLSLPAPVLGGRLYRGIFLLMNLLREHHDFVLISFGPPGDVEKSVLEEADGWLLVGSAGGQGEFHRLEAALVASGPGHREFLRVWLGPLGDAEASVQAREPMFLVPWPEDFTAEYERGLSPYQLLERFRKTARAIRRLARRLGGLTLGLAMGSGAALGYSLIGVLKGLRRAGLDMDVLAGTSMGAVIAGFYALGMEPEEIEAVATRVDKAWMYENLFWDLTVPRNGIFAGTTLLRFIRSYFGEKEFHELEIPYACVATDIETGEGIVLKDGRVADAIRASCGIPLLFSPFFHQGRFLVDGGLVDPVPARVVSQLGADILVAVNLTMPARRRKGTVRSRYEGRIRAVEELARLGPLKDLGLPEMIKSPNLLEILFETIYTMEYEIAQSRQDINHVVIQPELGGFSWTEMHRAREIIDAGERAAEEAVPKIKALLPFFADHGRVPYRPPGTSTGS